MVLLKNGNTFPSFHLLMGHDLAKNNILGMYYKTYELSKNKLKTKQHRPVSFPLWKHFSIVWDAFIWLVQAISHQEKKDEFNIHWQCKAWHWICYLWCFTVFTIINLYNVPLIDLSRNQILIPNLDLRPIPNPKP